MNKAVHPNGGGFKEKLKRSQSEIEHLRELLDLSPIPVEEWEAAIPQAHRDRYAAEALFVANGQVKYALIRLGIQFDGQPLNLAERIFGTPGCQALLNADLTDAEANRKEVIARMVKIARFGTDESAVRSTMILAKMAGWEKPTKINVESTQRTIFEIVGGAAPALHNVTPALPPAVDTIEGFLTHEPGEPVRVSSDDVIDEYFEGTG